MTALTPDQLTLQETVLATAMVQKMGDVATRYQVTDGVRTHSVEPIDLTP